MDIAELKSLIESKKYDGSFMIWKLTDDSSMFVARMYFKKIAKDNNLSIKMIESENEIADEGFGGCDNLYIRVVDALDAYEAKNNYIIICKSFKGESTIIPKLEPWQFIDYLTTKLSIGKSDLAWLTELYTQTDSRVTKTNYDRLDNDLDKIAIFPVSLHSSIFEDLYRDGEYDTVSNLTIFDLTNAIMTNDVKDAAAVLKVYDYIDSQPHVWLLSILLNNFKKVISIQSGQSAKDLGISDGQYYAIKKNNCGVYNISQLKDMYKILTDAEYMYKFGGLSMDNLSDYLICKMFMYARG